MLRVTGVHHEGRELQGFSERRQFPHRVRGARSKFGLHFFLLSARKRDVLQLPVTFDPQHRTGFRVAENELCPKIFLSGSERKELPVDAEHSIARLQATDGRCAWLSALHDNDSLLR